ncbi:MAG: CBM20 domain-containing protein [Bacteroidota bacterium]
MRRLTRGFEAKGISGFPSFELFKLNSSIMRNLLFLLAFLPFLSLSAQNFVRFEVKDIPEGAASHMGIRGSNAPLSWEKTYFLQKSDSNTYFALLQFPNELASLEYKFVIDDKKEVVWERLMNRRATLTKGSDFHFLSSWNTEDFIDPSTLAKLSVEELKQDFAVVREVIQSVHPGLYRYNDSASIQASLAELEEAFQQPRSYSEAYLSFAKFAASINCDHTHASLWNQEAIINSIIHRQADKLPFSFSWIGERMIINRHCIEGAELESGTEIMSINGIEAGEILSRMLPYLPSDGGLIANKISKALYRNK